MAMEAKVALLGEAERRLGSILTVDNMTEVMKILSDVVNDYDVNSTGMNPGTDDMLDAYLDALSVEGRSPKTIERYRYIIGRMQEAVHVSTRGITVYHLRKFLTEEKKRGISDRTLDGCRQVFSAYFNWLQRERLIDVNPCANIGAIKCRKKEKDIYSDVDIERMKFGCKSIRDRAIICFLGATGCRISEMVQLNRDSIDFNSLECTVLGKGNKERVVFLDQVTAVTIKAYLDTRTDDNPALFTGKGTERLHPGGVRAMLVKLGKSANVEHVHPHKFRRTTATTLIRHGMPVQEVAAILGHDKLDTTMQYVVLDKTDIKNSYRKFA
jgi:site-specific recombinase XerD